MKKESENIKVCNKKKIGIIVGGVILLAIVGVGLFIALSSKFSIGIIGGADGPTSIVVKNDTSLDEKVKLALISDNGERYLDGECEAEGHIILGSEEKENKTTVYALTMYGEYGFQDGNFVKVSGSGTIPAVITFEKNDNGEVLSTIEYPEDGSRYLESLKKMFPLKYHNRVISIKDEDSEILKEQEVKYATEYLKQIGREAKVGEYRDFEHKLFTAVGISVDASNKIIEMEKYHNYPMWLGTEEKIEDGIRYVYETKYDKENNFIIFTKSNYDTKEVVEELKVNSLTGEKFSH